MNHLDGVQAVAYCRLSLMDTDFNRTERQRKVVMLRLRKSKTGRICRTEQYCSRRSLTAVNQHSRRKREMPIAKSRCLKLAGRWFPFAKTTVRIGKKDCVSPMTLESNVHTLVDFYTGLTIPTKFLPKQKQWREFSRSVRSIRGRRNSWIYL